MKISVIIPTRNREGCLNTLLYCLSQQTVVPDEVIVVDGSDKRIKIPTKLKKFLKIKHIDNKKKFTTYARNEGMKVAKGGILLFIDDDCIPFNNVIERVVRFFDTKREASVLVGRMLNQKPIKISSFVQQWYYDRWLNMYGLLRSKLSPILHGSLTDYALLAIPRKLQLKYRFNEKLPFGKNEDMEMGIRIYKSHKKMFFDPFMCAYHLQSQNLFGLLKRNFMNGYSDGYVIKELGIIVPRNSISLGKRMLAYLNVFKEFEGNVVKKLFALIVILVYPIFSKLGRLCYNITH